MDKAFKSGDAQADATAIQQMVRDLLKKAEEYLLGLEMETDFKSDVATMRTLQLALLEDFIEIHNAALRSNLRLPEDKAEIDTLIT